MAFIFKRLILVLSIAAAYAADKDAGSFKPGTAASYANHQTNARITIGVEPYATDDKAKLAFGKVNPYQYGILPVLVVIQNDSEQSIKLDRLKVEYVGPGHDRVDATPAREIRYLRPPQRPNVITGPAGIPKVLKTNKNPLREWEIEGREFAA